MTIDHQNTEHTTQENSASQDVSLHPTSDTPVSDARASQPDGSDRPIEHTSDVKLTPRTNLYTSDQGWTLIAALPDADQTRALLETEGSTLKLSVPFPQVLRDPNLWL